MYIQYNLSYNKNTGIVRWKVMRNMRLSKEKLIQLQNYFKNEKDIILVYLFGSYGTERETSLSDIDFAVLFSKSSKIDLRREMKIMAQISLLLNIEKVDLVNLNKAPVCLQHEIISSGDLIFEREELQTANFVKQVLTFYYDEKIRSEKFYKIYGQVIKEEYLDER